jgi:hypothetical protein
MSKNGFTIDTTNFNRALVEMSRLSGVDYEQIVKAEIGSILSATITNTPKATKASIEKGMAFTYVTNKELVNASWRLPDAIWNKVQQRKKELIRRIGTAKKSWFLLSKQMGIKLPKLPPAYVASSAVNGKELTEDVSHLRKVSGNKIGFFLENSTRSAVRGGGRAALLKAINGRTGYFYRNLRSGVFKKVSTIAKRYPGFQVRGI